jgi:regulator of nucleoside diphosphate kinase
MQTINNRLVLRKDDYEILISYLKGRFSNKSFDSRSAEALQAELRTADLVSKEEFPGDVVRLKSRVRVKDEESNRILELALVTPDKADIRQGKISFMAPVGMALIGFRKGQTVQWDVPSGKKSFMILEVDNNEQ